jgi:hypothetical protein
MEPAPVTLDDDLLETLRLRRAELRESLNTLEIALAAPTQGDAERWWQHVHVALVELFADFREHMDVTEGPGGLHEEMSRSAPWLSGPVGRLQEEHEEIRRSLDDLLAREPATGDASIDQAREDATLLLGQLVRHRQRSADLLYEALEVDIGGET